MEKDELIKKIFEYAKKQVSQASLGNVDRTTGLFYDLLNELGETEAANELESFYFDLMGEEE